jgi:hypothetical protein
VSKSYGNPQQAVLAYAAGIIDGEGCLRIVKSNPYRQDMINPHYSVSIQVGMKVRVAVDLLMKLFGGSIYIERTPHGPLYRWRINSKRQVIVALKKLLPYLLVKKEEAEYLLSFAKKLKPAKHGGKPMTDEELAFREESYLRMRELKKCDAAATTECRNPEKESDSLTPVEIAGGAN